MVVVLFFTSLVTIILFYNYYWKRRHLPPGPAPLPLVGNLIELKQCARWEEKFGEWQQKYGDVFTYWLGELPFVAITSYDLCQKYFVRHGGDTFSTRLIFDKTTTMLRGGYYGVIMTSGDLWRDQRKFALKVLRDFGLGRNQMEDRILEEVSFVIDNVKADLDHGTVDHDLYRYTDLAVGSVINRVICGYRFTTHNRASDFYRLRQLTMTIIASISSVLSNLAIKNPWLFNVPVVGDAGRHTINTMKEIYAFLDGVIQAHLNENDYTQEMEPRDFIDAFLLERARLEAAGEKNHFFSMPQLKSVCFDLWIAGQECQRFGNIVAQNIPRQLPEDANIEGYNVRKGAVVIPMISVIMNDPKAFPNPKKFDPLRFLDDNGHLKQIDEMIPFSLGKRICLGEGLAKVELFLMIANIFNQFEISAAKEPPSCRKAGGNSTFTEPFKCRIKRLY